MQGHHLRNLKVAATVRAEPQSTKLGKLEQWSTNAVQQAYGGGYIRKPMETKGFPELASPTGS